MECEQEVKAAVARLVDITREKTRTTLLEGDAPQKAQGSGAGAAGREAGEEGAPVVPEEAAENVGKNPPTADAANPCIAAMHEANQLRRQRCLDVKERLQHLQDPAIVWKTKNSVELTLGLSNTKNHIFINGQTAFLWYSF